MIEIVEPIAGGGTIVAVISPRELEDALKGAPVPILEYTPPTLKKRYRGLFGIGHLVSFGRLVAVFITPYEMEKRES